MVPMPITAFIRFVAKRPVKDKARTIIPIPGLT